MVSTFWEQVMANGLKVPDDRPLDELTTELTQMLGDPDPRNRHAVAYPTLATWVSDGVYDDLLHGLGDGMAAGLEVGLGENGTDSVFRRSYSCLVLAECLSRNNKANLLTSDTVLAWGDRVSTWLIRERDLRGHVHGKGWAHAVAHGADALGELGLAEAMGQLELTVLLDVIADRLVVPTDYHLVNGESDRLALATMRIMRRDLVRVDVLEPWVARLAHHAQPGEHGEKDPYLVTGNVQGYLRALHLQLALSPEPPGCRADLLLVLIDALKAVNARYLR